MSNTLDKVMEKKSSNLQFIKFIAAILVIVSHAYPITQGSNETEPLLMITNGQLSFGGLAVGIFFFSAGLFIAKSAEKNHTAKSFFIARCKRIFPPLLFTVILTMIVGGVLTTLSLKEYVMNFGTWKYLLNGILIPIHNLPRVFENHPYLPTVNGALWTLPVEFACYIGCFIAYKCGLLTGKGGIVTGILVLCGAFGTIVIQGIMPGIVNIIRPCIMFGIGMLYWIYREKIIVSGKGAMIGSFLFVVSLFTGSLIQGLLDSLSISLSGFEISFANVGMYLFLPYVIICLSYFELQVPDVVAKLGNLSYGIYLCGFPIQQTVVELYQRNHVADQMVNAILPGDILPMLPVHNMILAVPIACVIGFVIYFITAK